MDAHYLGLPSPLLGPYRCSANSRNRLLIPSREAAGITAFVTHGIFHPVISVVAVLPGLIITGHLLKFGLRLPAARTVEHEEFRQARDMRDRLDELHRLAAIGAQRRSWHIGQHAAKIALGSAYAIQEIPVEGSPHR